MQWLDDASVENKLAAVYLFVNNGAPITTTLLITLFKYIYPEAKNVCQLFQWTSRPTLIVSLFV